MWPETEHEVVYCLIRKPCFLKFRQHICTAQQLLMSFLS